MLALGLVFASTSLRAQGDLNEHRRQLRDLQPKIDRAIDTGVEWLISQQLRDGSWSFLKNDFPNGQTALAVYTLLKCDLPPHHPAVVRGLAFLDREAPRETYSLACQIMALEATHDPKVLPKIEALTKTLLKWGDKGSWGYPAFRPDLSNIQYAALGLRAAHLAGAKVPKKDLKALVNAALKYQEKAKAGPLPPIPPGVDPKPTTDSYGRTPSRLEYGKERRKRVQAGFFYERGSMRTPTGSMTTAGMGILLITNSILDGNVPRGMRVKMNKAVQHALNWFRKNWSVETNPGMDKHHHFYYLYGLERVGSLLEEEIVADHPWYFEGARWLVDNQEDPGSWVDREGNPFAPPGSPREEVREHVTCFALLFLKRATFGGGTTGDIKRKRGFRTYRAEAKDAPVRMKGAGDAKLSFWITGFSDAVRDQYKPLGGLRVQKVEYFVDGKSIGVLPGDLTKPWTIQKYPMKHTFTEEGEFTITVKVDVAGVDAEGKAREPQTLASPGFVAGVDAALSDWMVPEATARGTNRLHPRDKKAESFDPSKPPPASKKKPLFTVKASSSRNQDEQSAAAVDNRQDTHWICDPKEGKPWIALKMRKGIKADAIRLSQACRNADEASKFDRITHVEIEVNGKKNVLKVELEAEVLASTLIRLPKRTSVKSLRIRIVGRRPNETNPGCAGFSEIALE